MEAIDDCLTTLKRYLRLLQDTIEEKSKVEENYVDFQQTQTAVEAMISDKDKNIDKILDQQKTVRYILESDGRVRSLREKITLNQNAVDQLRKSCHEQSIQFIAWRSQLLQDQAQEIERFQMQQMKSISEDQRRHKTILDTRKKEIAHLEAEIENEEKNRAAILKDIEEKLDIELRRRRSGARGETSLGNSTTSMEGAREGGDGGVGGSVNDELFNHNHIELTSVDEYAPYGPTSTSDVAPGSTRSRGGGRGGGRSGRGGGRGRGGKKATLSTQS